MESKDKNEKSGVAKIREIFYEIKRKQKPSPELEEAVRQKKPIEESDSDQKPKRKIATPKPDRDLDL